MRDTTIELTDKRNKIVQYAMAIFGKESKREAIETIIEEYAKTKDFKDKLLKDLENK